VRPTDVVVFIFEFTSYLQRGDQLDLLRLFAGVPRGRRIVVDCDGKYNDPVSVDGDANHPDAAAARRWVEVCDSLSDKICQPTLRPRRPNVISFLFHAYNPAWEHPLDFRQKEYAMVYVGNNWFRWRPLQRLLQAIESVRERVGRLGLVGQGWASPEPWGGPAASSEAYHTDPAYLRRIGVELMAPVRFDQVVTWMSKGVFSPVVYRPLFDALRLVTCRTFETPAANTIPLFAQAQDEVADIHGDAAVALALGDQDPAEKILDVLAQPERYAGAVEAMRRHLAERHSYATRFHDLLRIAAA
jgi:glycosyltransferase involved in cell wall biosynthesis